MSQVQRFFVESFIGSLKQTFHSLDFGHSRDHWFVGFLTGCLLGQPVTGAVVGATINLVYLGFISAGGSMPADMALAGVLGVAYAITGNLDADTALAIAVPIGLLGTIVWSCV